MFNHITINTPLLGRRPAVHSLRLRITSLLAALLPSLPSDAQSPSLTRRAIATYDLFLNSINTMGIIAAAENILLGWPSVADEGTEILEIINPFLCAVTCLVGIQALHAEKKRQENYRVNQDVRQAEAKLRILLDRALSSISAGASTANFSLDTLIALVLEFEARNGQEYDVSEIDFWLKYMLPTTFLGASHAYLDFTRHRFSEQHPESRVRKSFKHLIHVLAYGSIINASSTLVAETFFNFNEHEGSEDKRFYMYSASTLLAIVIEVIAESLRKCPDRLMNTLSAFTLLTALFLPAHLESLGEALTISEEIFWPVLLTITLASGFRYAPHQSSEEFEALLENAASEELEASQENHADNEQDEEAVHNQDEAPHTQADVENEDATDNKDKAPAQSPEKPVSTAMLKQGFFHLSTESRQRLREIKNAPNNKHRRSFSF